MPCQTEDKVRKGFVFLQNGEKCGIINTAYINTFGIAPYLLTANRQIAKLQSDHVLRRAKHCVLAVMV